MEVAGAKAASKAAEPRRRQAQAAQSNWLLASGVLRQSWAMASQFGAQKGHWGWRGPIKLKKARGALGGTARRWAAVPGAGHCRRTAHACRWQLPRRLCVFLGYVGPAQLDLSSAH